MIPLSQWLAESHNHDVDVVRLRSLHEIPETIGNVGLPDTSALLKEAYQQGHRDAIDALNHDAAMIRDELRNEYEQRESLLVQEWAARCSSEVGGAVEAAFLALQESIEGALCDVLRPFLGELARLEATRQLLRLLREDVERNPDGVLEIRAPVILHPELKAFFETSGLAPVLVVSQSVEVVVQGASYSFEDMSAKWIESIRQDGQ